MQIDKDIPPPVKNRSDSAKKSLKPSGRASYPFKDMVVGDSILIENEADWQKAVNAAFSHGKKHDKNFMSRRTTEGMRIWMIDEQYGKDGRNGKCKDGRGLAKKWPFLDMGVGQVVSYSDPILFSQVRAAVQYAKRTNGYRMRTRIKEGVLYVKRFQ